jgi:PilZ domain
VRTTIRARLEWLKEQFGVPAPPPPGGERRTHPRKRMRFEAEISGKDLVTAVVGVDIHENGARILSKEKWETGTVLFIKLPIVQLGGFAEVRHCSLRKDGRYNVGLAFRGPLIPQGAQWQIARYCQPASDAWTAHDDKPTTSEPNLPPVRKKPREVA